VKYSRVKRRAFTIVEVMVAGLVAITILGIVCLMAHSVWNTYYLGTARAQAMHAAQIVLECVEQDLLCAVLRKPDSLAGRPMGPEWSFPIVKREKSKVARTAVKYELKPRRSPRGSYTLVRNGAPIRSAPLTALVLAWSKKPGQLVLEVEAIDDRSRTRFRMAKLIGVPAAEQWARYGKLFAVAQ
jgi:type II secretory pathway pseudopilin PulG